MLNIGAPELILILIVFAVILLPVMIIIGIVLFRKRNSKG